MSTKLPTDASGLTPEWVRSALDHRFPGVEIEAVREIDRSASTNLHLRLEVAYGNWSDAPPSIFAKLPPQDASHRQAIGAAAMGAREAHFYSAVAPTLSMRVPDAYFTAIGEDGSFVLLLEDLGAGDARISDGTWAVPGELAPRAMEELAQLHIAYEDPARRAGAVWAAPAPRSNREPLLAKLQQVITEHADELSDAYVAVGHLYIEHHLALEEIWNDGPPTLLHGDPHIGNLFVERDRVGYLDWGMSTIGAPLRDVSYFLTMGVEPDDRRRMQRDLLAHYLDARRKLGGTPISLEDAWQAHRVLAGYNVVASFLGLTPPYNVPERHVFSSRFRERAMLALDDLDTVAAINAAVAR